MEPFAISMLEICVTAFLTAMIGGMWTFLVRFAHRQKLANDASRDFERSMQRAEIIRYFRIVVEQGHPITTEELSHLESCYQAYHNAGGNGTGTVMYNRVMEHVKIVTTAQGENDD